MLFFGLYSYVGHSVIAVLPGGQEMGQEEVSSVWWLRVSADGVDHHRSVTLVTHRQPIRWGNKGLSPLFTVWGLIKMPPAPGRGNS